MKSFWVAWTTAWLQFSCVSVALHRAYHSTSEAPCMIQAFPLGAQSWKNRSVPLKCAAKGINLQNQRYYPTRIRPCQFRDIRHITTLTQLQRRNQWCKTLSINSQQSINVIECRHYLLKRAASRKRIRFKCAINSSSKPITIFQRSKTTSQRWHQAAIRN